MPGARLSTEQKLRESFSLQSGFTAAARRADSISKRRTCSHREGHRPSCASNWQVVCAILLSARARYLWPLDHFAEVYAMLATKTGSQRLQGNLARNSHAGTRRQPVDK